MLFAVDYNDNRVHIDQIHSNQTYYCPYCGVPLTVRKGEIRKHHFAHTQQHRCTDTWTINEHDGGYDTSSWHNEWQSCFPKENQEIKLTLGEIKHRADVLIDRTVIEFQHSIMSEASFDDRNNFYANLGYKVVWLFDMSDLYAKGQMEIEECANELKIFWKNPKKAFNCYDIQSGCIDLFFELNDEEKNIIRVKDVSANGFESFSATTFISKTEFLQYVGLEDGGCLPPAREDLEQKRIYQEFKEKYNIQLNQQQERAVQAVEGANLLLAVPGSGKTTVLVTRLGHMVINKKIAPENILAVTYTKDAAQEMKKRFCNKFGKAYGEKIEFRTINSLCNEIYKEYCKKYHKDFAEIIEEGKRKSILRNIYQECVCKEVYENNIHELMTDISNIKNLRLSDEQISKAGNDKYPLRKMYKRYEEALKQECKIDFDDQMVRSLKILEAKKEILDEYRSRFKYICVDEAQDTSKIQHEILSLLAQGNNVFMVGDEDQSIYGFRGAYPKALLNFRYDYINPYILRMEKNYRSTESIVEIAQKFISKNAGRYNKNMVAVRTSSEKVTYEIVASREEQYVRLLEIAKNTQDTTAFLYRDNESAIVLVDLLLRNNISFKLKKPQMNFFNTQVVKDIIAYLTIAIDSYNAEQLKQIVNHGILYLKEKQKYYAIEKCKNKGISVYDAVEEQMEYVEARYRDRARKFKNIMQRVSNANAYTAISILEEEGYRRYLEEKHISRGNLEILLMLAKNETTIVSFLQRLKLLEKLMQEGFEGARDSKIVLSTIHSSKGLEYDCVYMVDVYDGRFPSSAKEVINRSKDNFNGEQEERRLFYVGITRAENTLKFFSIKDKPSSYIEELFPEITEKRVEEDIERRIRETEERNTQKSKNRAQEVNNIYENVEANRKIRIVEERQASKSKRQTVRQKCYEEVKDMFAYQETPIYDSQNNRWVKCEICGEINTTDCFAFYGGKNGALGVCNSCNKKKK